MLAVCVSSLSQNTATSTRCAGARVGHLPMGSVLRTGQPVKVLVGADDRILGFTMIGSEAGEVMAAVQTAMLAGLPYQPEVADADSHLRVNRRIVHNTVAINYLGLCAITMPVGRDRVLSLTAYTLNPVPGIWTLIVYFPSPVAGKPENRAAERGKSPVFAAIPLLRAVFAWPR